MERKITIKGTGSVAVKPDYVIISLTVEEKDRKYTNAVGAAEKKIRKLGAALAEVGFEEEALKTADFRVRTNYSFVNDRKHTMQRQFEGYTCTHRLQIAFDYDMALLGKALSVVSGSLANPQLDITFTVKDKEAVTDQLLADAAKNARRKAELLCTAAGGSLGSLVTVEYDWSEIDVYTKTGFNIGDTCMMPLAFESAVPTADIRPNDINVSDTATFVWEIL